MKADLALSKICPDWTQKKDIMTQEDFEDLSDYDMCLVGEAWKYDGQYRNKDGTGSWICAQCYSYANAFFEDYRDNDEFDPRVLDEFTKHFYEKHGDKDVKIESSDATVELLKSMKEIEDIYVDNLREAPYPTTEEEIEESFDTANDQHFTSSQIADIAENIIARDELVYIGDTQIGNDALYIHKDANAECIECSEGGECSKYIGESSKICSNYDPEEEDDEEE